MGVGQGVESVKVEDTKNKNKLETVTQLLKPLNNNINITRNLQEQSKMSKKYQQTINKPFKNHNKKLKQ